MKTILRSLPSGPYLGRYRWPEWPCHGAPDGVSSQVNDPGGMLTEKRKRVHGLHAPVLTLF